jgi:hypothetical protein
VGNAERGKNDENVANLESINIVPPVKKVLESYTHIGLVVYDLPT